MSDNNNIRKRTVGNPGYDAGKNYETIQLDQMQANGERARDLRLSTRMAMEGNQEVDYDEEALKKSLEALMDELPSRQLAGYGGDLHGKTIRVRKSLRYGRGDEVDALEDGIVDTFQEELDDETADIDDIDRIIKTMPATMASKRKIMQRLSSTKRKTKLSRCKLCQYRMQMTWVQFKHKLRKGARMFDLWRSHLMKIEGCFGTSVLSYFIFLKWVLLINLPIFLLTFCLIVIPQILYRYDNLDGYEDSKDFEGIEILTGTGFFENTEMYYGFYTNKTVEMFGSASYHMKYAYLMTCGGYYILCLLILGYSYLHSYRKYYIEASGTVSLYYFGMVLSGWDYGIVSQEASQLKHKSIYNEFKEYLAGRKHTKVEATSGDVVKKWIFRGFTWFIVLALLGGSGYATYKVSIELSLKLAEKDDIPVVSSLAMPVIISTMQLFVPMMFTFLEKKEQYTKPKYELYVHMFRDMALKASQLGVLCYFWFHIAADKVKCWETFVGQEIYRLVIVDLIFTLGYSLFIEFVRRLLSTKWEKIDRSTFAIGRHTLELIYSQSLCWLGVFYSPLLPVVVIIKLIIIFYVKRISVVQNCRPSLKPWRASRTHTIFVGYLFLFFVLSCVAVGCGIFLIKPSTTCGPYKFYETSYDVVKDDLIEEWKEDHEVWREIFSFINSPGFIVGLLVVLGMIWYYTRTVMTSHKEIVEQFKRQLQSEGKDKKFLMNLLNQVKVRGRPVSKQKGTPLKMEMEKTVPSKDGDNKHVFVKEVAKQMSSRSLIQ